MRFLEYRLPALLDLFHHILAIPSKRVDVSLITYLSMSELEAILNAPDVRTRMGIRDRAMLHMGFTTGLRVSELISVLLTTLTFHPTPSIRVWDKGRRERSYCCGSKQQQMSVRGSPCEGNTLRLSSS